MDKIYLFCPKESGALIELSLGSMNKFGPWSYQCAVSVPTSILISS